MRINLIYFKAFKYAYSKSFLEALIWLFLVILVVSFMSCNDNKPDQYNCIHVHLTHTELKESKSKKILLLVADDRSGSTQDKSQPERITEGQYKILLQTFIEHGYTGEFAIRVIGNTPHTGFKQTLTFDPLFDSQQIPNDATLTEKGRLRCINKCIGDTCEKITKRNQQKVDEYITNVILPDAIGYQPSGSDATDIDGAFRDIEMRLDASVNIGFDETIVVIMSDGKDSNNSRNLIINTSSPFELILIGWPKDRIVKDDKEKKFDSVDQLINWFKNNKF